MWPAIRTGYRSLLNRPGFFLAAVLTLTLCIGANSLMFTLIDAVLLRDLPYAGSERLVALFETNVSRNTGLWGVAPVRVEEWGSMAGSFSGVAGAYTENVTDTSTAVPEKLFCALTSPRFFSVLGAPPLIGRTFAPDEERFGGPTVALIGERFWRRRFAGDPAIVGKALRIKDTQCPIAGVMPASFRLPIGNDDIDVWIPAALPDVVLRNRQARFYSTVARLKDGVPVASAQADLDIVQGRLSAQHPATDAQWAAVLKPLRDATVGGSKQGLWTLFAAVGMLLIAGCANVACLLLAQSQRRARELAIRFSLGASRSQVVRQLLLESFLLALPGSLLGLLLTVWGADALRVLVADRLPRAEGLALNWQVVAFTLSLSLLTTLIFGLLPALTATRKEHSEALVHGSRTQVGGRFGLLKMLVAPQMALAIVLLVGAGLLIRSMLSLAGVPLGFDTRNVLTMRVTASWAEQGNSQGLQRRLERTLQALESVPGVQSAAITLNLPGGSGADYNLELRVAGRQTDDSGQKMVVNAPAVSASYFRTLGIPLLAGEMCSNNLDNKLPQHAMVNRQFADRYFPNQSPIGHTLVGGQGSQTTSTLIVGIVGDTRDTTRMRAPHPTVYWCTLPRFFPDPIYLIKAQGQPLAAGTPDGANNAMILAAALRERIKQIEPGRAVYGLAPLDEQIATTMGERRLQTLLLSSFGLTALLLASVGLYGVLGFYVSQRTREIGLRMALGARPAQVFRLVFRQGAVMTVGGVAAGIAAGALLTSLVASLLFEVDRWDPVTFVAAPVVLLLVAALATWIPARRATLVDPMHALREE